MLNIGYYPNFRWFWNWNHSSRWRPECFGGEPAMDNPIYFQHSFAILCWNDTAAWLSLKWCTQPPKPTWPDRLCSSLLHQVVHSPLEPEKIQTFGHSLGWGGHLVDEICMVCWSWMIGGPWIFVDLTGIIIHSHIESPIHQTYSGPWITDWPNCNWRSRMIDPPILPCGAREVAIVSAQFLFPVVFPVLMNGELVIIIDGELGVNWWTPSSEMQLMFLFFYLDQWTCSQTTGHIIGMVICCRPSHLDGHPSLSLCWDNVSGFWPQLPICSEENRFRAWMWIYPSIYICFTTVYVMHVFTSICITIHIDILLYYIL